MTGPKVRKYLKRDDLVCHQNEYHVCSQWYLTFAGMIGFYEVSCTWHPKPCKSVLGPNEIKRLLSKLKRAERTISHVSRSTYVKWHYIYYRYHHRINLYIIRFLVKKKWIVHQLSFLIHTFQNKKIHGFCPRFWGGASSSESDSDSGSSDSEEATPATREWVLKGTKRGKDMCFLLVIWDDFLWFEMTSGYLKWSHHIFFGVGHLWRTP